MVEIKTIEIDERTKEFVDRLAKQLEEVDKYIQSKIGISKEHLGRPQNLSNTSSAALSLT